MDETLAKFNADLQRNGNGSYEAWVAKLAPIRESWANRALHRDKMYLEDFSSPDGYVATRVEEALGDPTLRMDRSEPLQQIVRLNNQLKLKGIDLIFGLVPSNMEVFPEKFVDNPNLLPPDGIVTPYKRKFLHLLAQSGVEVIDFVDVLRSAKARPDADQLTLKNDVHFSDLGLVLAAQAVAERLERYDFVKAARPMISKYSADMVTVEGLGEKLSMWPVRMPDGRPFENLDSSPLLCIGDSNMQIYGVHNPMREWLPGPDFADFTAQLSRFTGVQTALLSVQGFTPDMLNREPLSTWRGRKVAVWISGTNVISSSNWGDVSLAPATNPKLLSPAPGTVFTKANASAVTFSWNALPEVQDYWLDVGTMPNRGNIFGGYLGATTTSKTIDLSGRLDGRPIYVGVYAKFWDYLVNPGVKVEFRTENPKK